jgi:DNA-binding GntR family transcriptional regulator
MEKKQPESLREEIYHKIKDGIITGTFPQGTLLTEGSLAKEMGASTTPVREALFQLHQAGLVTHIPQKGYLIKPVTVNDLQDMMDFRLIIERAIGEIVIEVITDEQIEYLEKFRYVQIDTSQINLIKETLDVNNDFHMFLASISRNQHLMEAQKQILDETARFQFMDYVRGEGLTDWPVDHGHIIDALKSRDKERLVEAIESGLVKTRNRLLLSSHIYQNSF